MKKGQKLKYSLKTSPQNKAYGHVTHIHEKIKGVFLFWKGTWHRLRFLMA
jgi:hypothetical protein